MFSGWIDLSGVLISSFLPFLESAYLIEEMSRCHSWYCELLPAIHPVFSPSPKKAFKKLSPTFNLTTYIYQAILDDVEFISDKVDFFDRLLAPGDAEYDFYFGADGHTTDEASRCKVVEVVGLSGSGGFYQKFLEFLVVKNLPTNAWKMVF